MQKTWRVIERFLPQSAIGLTLMTFVVMVVIGFFFVHDLHLVSVDGERDVKGNPLVVRGDLPRPKPHIETELESGESCYVGPTIDKGECGAKPSRAVVKEPVAVASSTNTITPPGAAPAKSSDRIATNSAGVADASQGVVASLTRTKDCRWADNAEEIKEGAQFKVGQTLSIAAGLAEIAFTCGARAILEGPAVLQLESNKSSMLQIGKLTADVPDEVEGFTIHTPTANLVSLCASQSKGVAKITASADCLWAEGNEAMNEGECLNPGQKVKLADGLAEITFQSGAKVILQGPADLEIGSSKTATLHQGRLTADVPDDLEGFKIWTPVVEILSLPSTEAASESAKSEEPNETPPPAANQ